MPCLDDPTFALTQPATTQKSPCYWMQCSFESLTIPSPPTLLMPPPLNPLLYKPSKHSTAIFLHTSTHTSPIFNYVINSLPTKGGYTSHPPGPFTKILCPDATITSRPATLDISKPANSWWLTIGGLASLNSSENMSKAAEIASKPRPTRTLQYLPLTPSAPPLPVHSNNCLVISSLISPLPPALILSWS